MNCQSVLMIKIIIIVDYDKVYFIRIDKSSLPRYVSLLHPFVTKIIIWNIDNK